MALISIATQIAYKYKAETLNVIIAGGRDMFDTQFAHDHLNELFGDYDSDRINVLSGKALGADARGEHWAKANGIKILPYPAEWENFETKPCKIKYNKFRKPYNCLAGFNRNVEMVKDGNILIAFWDKKSSGTRDVIQLANKHGLIVHIIYY